MEPTTPERWRRLDALAGRSRQRLAVLVNIMKQSPDDPTSRWISGVLTRAVEPSRRRTAWLVNPV